MLKKNNRGEFVRTYSKNLKVGDIIKIKSNETVQADVLVLCKYKVKFRKLELKQDSICQYKYT